MLSDRDASTLLEQATVHSDSHTNRLANACRAFRRERRSPSLSIAIDDISLAKMVRSAEQSLTKRLFMLNAAIPDTAELRALELKTSSNR